MTLARVTSYMKKVEGMTNEEICHWLDEHVEDFGLPVLLPKLKLTREI